MQASCSGDSPNFWTILTACHPPPPVFLFHKTCCLMAQSEHQFTLPQLPSPMEPVIKVAGMSLAKASSFMVTALRFSQEKLSLSLTSGFWTLCHWEVSP